MKRRMLIIAAAVLAVSAGSLRADLYTDTTGDLHNGVPSGDNLAQWTHLDIVSVEVTNTPSDIVFKIRLAGDPIAVNWGKYGIGIDTNAATGDISQLGNGWGRKITMAPRGMDFWVGCWVDGGGGAQLWHYDGAAWAEIAAGQVSTTTNSVTIRFPFANLSKGFGDSVDFDVYTTGGGQDPAVDALNNPAVAVTSWQDFYTNNAVSSYKLQTITVIPHTVTFRVDMGVPIWEYNTATADGFDPASDSVFVRGTFNGWAGSDQLFRDGTSTLYTNTITFLADPGGTIEYKFEGVSFPGWESPVRLNGGNRSLVLTNTALVAPLACFGDRCLSDPAQIDVQFNVDMSLQQAFGEFDPNAGDIVSIRGSLTGWDAPGLALTAGADPNTNIYSAIKQLYYYPTGVVNFEYKAKIESTAGTARNSGWESPISTGNNNRAFLLASANEQLNIKFNDETGLFSIEKVEKPDPNSAKLTFKAYGEGIYEILARATIGATPAVVGTVTNTSKYYGDVTFTHEGLTGVNQQYYQARFIGFNKPPLP